MSALHLSRFGRAVLQERAFLALSDPAGEWDAVVRWPWADALAFLEAELTPRQSVRPVAVRPEQIATDIDLLAALGADPGRGRGMIRCPAHEDRAPSLSWRLANDGRVLLHCFSGCTFDAIRTAVAP